MSSQFEFFRNSWLTHTDILSPFADEVIYTTSLDEEFFNSLKTDSNSTKQYRIAAALAAASQLGDNPVLCFSGGIDSQAMIQCWLEAGLKFDVAIMKFEKSLNIQDTSIALEYCKKYDIEPKMISVNVLQFLTRDHNDVADKYRCSSPHFTTHYRMFDILRNMGYTGICCGGTAFAKNHVDWGPVPSAAQANYIEYSKQNQFPIIGNFLGYDPHLCWSIGLLTPEHSHDWNSRSLRSTEESNHDRYLCKVAGYEKHGFEIIPQKTKYTGFELVKEYFAETYKDGWAFEKLFRFPQQKKFGIAEGRLVLTDEQKEVIANLYNKCSSSS